MVMFTLGYLSQSILTMATLLEVNNILFGLGST